MPSNKDRLYVALYARGGAPKMPGKEDTYHWALLVGPKVEVEGGRGMRYHAKERLGTEGGSEWFFEDRDTALAATSMILVRVMIGKIEHKDKLVKIMEQTPIRQGQPEWNCVEWVKEVLEACKAEGRKVLGTSVLDWSKIRNKAMEYVQSKKNLHRFDGQGDFDMDTVATYDLIDDKETIP